MAAPIVRTLTFNYSGLAQKTSILLCFEKVSRSQLIQNQHYVAWKVIECRPGRGSITVTYTGTFGFAQCQIDSGNHVYGTTYTPVPLGSLTLLKKNSDGDFTFDEPKLEPSYGTLIKARNSTDMRQDISVGMINEGSAHPYEPAFVWKGVGSGMSVEVDLHPTILAYVGMSYKEGQLMTADLTDEVPIWTQSLASLSPTTTYEFKEKDQGGFTLTPL